MIFLKFPVCLIQLMAGCNRHSFLQATVHIELYVPHCRSIRLVINCYLLHSKFFCSDWPVYKIPFHVSKIYIYYQIKIHLDPISIKGSRQNCFAKFHFTGLNAISKGTQIHPYWTPFSQNLKPENSTTVIGRTSIDDIMAGSQIDMIGKCN